MIRTKSLHLCLAFVIGTVLAPAASLAQGEPRGSQQDSQNQKPGALPRKAQAAKKDGKGGTPGMSTAPAPKTGSMPKGGPTPTGKLGTEPRSKGKLGTDPKPGDPQSRPPRPQ